MRSYADTNYQELVTWLLKQIDDDLLWAREASRDEFGGFAESGTHWVWKNTDTDEVLTPDPGTSGHVGGPDDFRVSLRSKETWPAQYDSLQLPQFALSYCEEVPSAVGGHIIRHDPARVIRDLTARRRSVLMCRENLAYKLADSMLRDMAETYAERPGYRQDWRPFEN